jgi:hypothetical protein
MLLSKELGWLSLDVKEKEQPISWRVAWKGHEKRPDVFQVTF